MSDESVELTIDEFQELIEESATDIGDAIQEALDDSDADAVSASGKWGVYCNCLKIDSGSGGNVHYRRGKKGTSNYGCGRDQYYASKSLAKYIKVVGSCSNTACGNKRKYLVTNYRT